jgi:transcription antitermination factor NusG
MKLGTVGRSDLAVKEKGMDPYDILGFQAGDRLRVVDGTFAGMEGDVLSHEQAQERRRPCGLPEYRPAPEQVWVLLELFGRPVPVPLQSRQVEHP